MHSDAEQMNKDLSKVKSKFLENKQKSTDVGQAPPLADKEHQMRMDHINSRLTTGKYYQMHKIDDNGTGMHFAFQVVCKHPARRSYIQRVCLLGTDVTWLYRVFKLSLSKNMLLLVLRYVFFLGYIF